MTADDSTLSAEFLELVRVIRALRDPDTGCPWDKVQTHTSLKPYMLEESYELLDAIDAGEAGHIREELGDVLLQVLLHSQIGSDEKTFTLEDVVRTLRLKLVERHPHVFGTASASTPDEVRAQWEAQKAEKRRQASKDSGGKEEKKSALHGIARALPGLRKAQLMGERVVSLGFDWPDRTQVVAKLDEEFSELLAEVEAAPENRTRIEEELGDLLFTAAQLARHVGIEAEDALQKGCEKFRRRFSQVEQALEHPGPDAPPADRATLTGLWRKVKDGEH